MIRNDPDDFAQRFYARVPDSYRAYDVQEGYPLLALFSAAGYQAAAIRRDLDDLWNDFFIESCADWVVPYIGALLGTELLPDPVGQSSRLEVWKTIDWRRSRGTPAMLREMAAATTGWDVAFAEFFTQIGWSQNLNHIRLARALTADLRKPARLARLGHADDPFAHAVGIRPAGAFDGPRVTLDSGGVPVAAWGTPGRYLTTNVGFFAGPLQAFAVRGATPAAAPPGIAPPADACAFTFDPLFRDIALFSNADGRPIARETFAASPWPAFGRDLVVMQDGVPLATTSPRASAASDCAAPFTFGGRADGVALDAKAGMRALVDVFGGSPDFALDAIWITDTGGERTVLGTLRADGFTLGAAAPPGTGTLAIAVRSAQAARVRRFPRGTIALRAARASGAGLHEGDGVFANLLALYAAPGSTTMRYVAADGTTGDAPFTGGTSSACAPAVYPPRAVSPSVVPLKVSDVIDASGRAAGDPVLADPARLGDVTATLGLPPKGTPPGASLTVTITASPAAFVAPTEWAVPLLAGGSLLVYVPQIDDAPGAQTTFVVADDGSTYYAPPLELRSPGSRATTTNAVSLNAPMLARAALGQTLPIAGVWPLQQRVPIAADSVRGAYVPFGALGIDPERGWIVLANGDPVVGSAALSVVYAEGFTARIGAFASSSTSTANAVVPPNPLVVSARGPYTTLAAALKAAGAAPSVTIEIADSATYVSATPLAVPQTMIRLVVRAAAGARPVLAFYDASGAPASASFKIAHPMDLFELDGVVVSGGPLLVSANVNALLLSGTTLDPRTSPSLVTAFPAVTAPPFAASPPPGTVTPSIAISSCVTGALQIGGAAALQLADTIVDARGGDAIVAKNAALTLDRVTVFGRVTCLSIAASDTLLDDVATASDKDTGYVRFTRYEPGSSLPSAFASTTARPSFESYRWGRPAYARLAVRTPAVVTAGSDRLAEVGAFASRLDTIRLANLARKTEEFLPAALSAIAIAET
ncbi:MAG TPA: hypothetical protein VK669_09615 [Candidatus Limnocylindrales bacterium]|nr:hypothetical protein [Candidatus Limnocylindrales bacterium]